MYDFFNTEEFLKLPTYKRIYIRFKIAFFETLTMF